MSKHFEIFGKGITVNTAEIIWHWLNTNLAQQERSVSVDQLMNILDHISNREHVPAQDKLNVYLYENPDCIFGRLSAATICLQQNEPEKAIEQVQSVYLRQPTNTMALYTLGYCYERLGFIEQAVEFYQDCLKFKSFLQLPRQRMAAIYIKEGRYDKAIREYEKLTSEHPEDVSSIVHLGYLYLSTHRYEQAIDTFNLAILSHPDNFLAGQEEDEVDELLRSGAHDQALERVHHTIEQVGPMPDLIIRMGDIYSHAGRDAEAIACYEHVNRMQPSSLEGTIKLGTMYLRSRKFSLAAEQFNRAADINDEIVDAYIGLATAQNKSGLESDASQTLSLASSILQNSTLLYSESATLQFQALSDEHSKPSDASDKAIILIDDVIRAYQRQLKTTPDRPDVHYKYGILMMVENNLSLAISEFQNTLSHNPMHYRAKNKLAVCYYDNGQIDSAINVLSDYPAVNASMLEMYYRTSILYCDKKAFADALKKLHLVKSTAQYENSGIQANLEIILENLGLVDRAFTNWKRLEETSENLFINA